MSWKEWFVESNCRMRAASVCYAKHLIAAGTALISAGWCSDLSAQDLEPRAYSNSPVGTNFVILGYGYASGTVLTDPSLPIENVSNESHIGILAYARVLNVFGKSAKFDMIVPFAGLRAEGLVFGQPHERDQRVSRSALSIFDKLHRRARAHRSRVRKIPAGSDYRRERAGGRAARPVRRHQTGQCRDQSMVRETGAWHFKSYWTLDARARAGHHLLQ
jgi:hypothetical protein